jgi:hypothetical protein
MFGLPLKPQLAQPFRQMCMFCGCLQLLQRPQEKYQALWVVLEQHWTRQLSRAGWIRGRDSVPKGKGYNYKWFMAGYGDMLLSSVSCWAIVPATPLLFVCLLSFQYAHGQMA